MIEIEIANGRRAFPETQRLFAGTAISAIPALVAVGWYETSVSPERGAFAVVSEAGGLDDLIGEVVRVTAGDRSVLVYVIGYGDVPTPLAVARRAFFGLGLLAEESLSCVVEVIG